MCSTYHNHRIGFGCNLLCLSLTLLCSIADSVHNTNIITFFHKNFN